MLQPNHRAYDGAPERAPLPGDACLAAEHAQLIGENLAYMALLARCARAVGLCSTLEIAPLTERLLEGLCLETQAMGGLLWLAAEEPPDSLRLCCARGTAKPEGLPATALASAPPAGLERLGEPGLGAFLAPAPEGGGRQALCVRLRHGGRLLALVRVEDRADGADFDAGDLAAADQVAEIAAPALANALRFRAVLRGATRDRPLHTCSPAFLDGLVATELEKALRFGRPLSLIEIELAGMAGVRERLGDSAARVLGEGFGERLQQAMRGTDVCAAEGESSFRLLLAETDALGAAVMKRRIRDLVGSPQQRGSEPATTPVLRIAAASFPADGTRLEDLRRRLAERLEDEPRSVARRLERECRSFAECQRRLLREAVAMPPRLPEQALRFALEELSRHAHERALVWLCPGAELRAAAFEELARLRGRPVRAEILLIEEEDPEALLGLPLSRLSPHRAALRAPFLIYLGETLAYAWLRERDGDGAPFFHSSDRALVEHLAFQLQRDLGMVAP